MYILKSYSNEKKHNIVLLGAQHNTPKIKLSTPEIKLCNYSGRHCIRTTMSNDTATVGVKKGGSRVGGPELCV